MSGVVMGLLFAAVVLVSCWHGISATVANSVPRHVPDLTTCMLGMIFFSHLLFYCFCIYPNFLPLSMLSFSGQPFPFLWLLFSMAKLDTLISCPTWKAEVIIKSGTCPGDNSWFALLGAVMPLLFPAVVLLSCFAQHLWNCSQFCSLTCT